MSRGNNYLLSNWWWKIDKVTLGIVLSMIGLGLVFVGSASTSVAERIGLDGFHFLKKHFFYALASICIIFLTSMFSVKQVKLSSLIGIIICFFLLIMVLLWGQELKGAKRWITILGFSMQPSEFVKPFFAITNAIILSCISNNRNIFEYKWSLLFYIVITSLVLMEPDLGMTVMISAIWGIQIFIAGISFVYVFILLNLFFMVLFVSYFFFPHVAKRIDGFLTPEAESNYQINRSLLAIENGGIFGKGPGEGVIKNSIPDSHADFIFAVIGEELGMIFSIVIILTYLFLVTRGMIKLLKERDVFIFYAVSGLLMQIAFQSIINIGVTVKLFPAKGMTLPFISYGGSAMLSVALSVGFILALTRKKYSSIKSNFIKI